MDWLSDHVWAAWLGVSALLVVGEMFSLDLILLMLAVGALGGMAVALAGAPFAAQAIVAAVAAVAMLAVVRPSMARRLHQGPDLKQGHEKVVGQRGTVTEPIGPLQVGRIKVAGEIWSASPYDDTLTIQPGETVEVLQIRGATAYVHPVPSLES